jgi:RNA polymerase sigma factor (sigma-70 family)
LRKRNPSQNISLVGEKFPQATFACFFCKPRTSTYNAARFQLVREACSYNIISKTKAILLKMNSDWLPTEESWKGFLAWLDADNETAARKYEEIRAALIAFFIGRRWTAAEDLADEVINRVMQRGTELFDGYVGEPKHYFRKVAHNLHLDYLRKHPPAAAEELNENTSHQAFFEAGQEEQERRYACLEACIQHLTKDNRYLVVAYHEKNRSAKIEQHKQLADSLGITVNALRLRVFRLHGTLRDCVTKCLQA